MCDSSSVICLAQNPFFHGGAKHIKVRHYFLRDHVEMRDIEIKYIDTERHLAYIFTKLLDATRFASLRGGGGTWCFPPLWHGLRGASVLPYIYSILFSSHCILFIST
jgi:hypothetical protein